MARKSDPLSDNFGSDDTDGWLGGIVADEDHLDRRTLWRLGLWGVAAISALTLAIMSGQLPVNALRTQLAADDVAGRARQIEAKMQENLLEARRLTAAVETLNGDRDRVFARLSNLEQGLDVVTGSIKKVDDKPAAPPWPEATTPLLDPALAMIVAPKFTPAPVPQPQPVAAVPAPQPQPLPAATAPASEPEITATVVAARAAPPPAETAVVKQLPAIQAMPIPDAKTPATETDTKAADEQPVVPADFAVDLGAANSLNGLRALWRGLIKSNRAEFEGLRPLIAIRERRNGLGLQLRLIGGPIKDAATVAHVCAVLSSAKRDCTTASFDGQRLSLASEPEERAAPSRPAKRKPTSARHPAEEAKAEAPSLSSRLGFR